MQHEAPVCKLMFWELTQKHRHRRWYDSEIQWRRVFLTGILCATHLGSHSEWGFESVWWIWASGFNHNLCPQILPWDFSLAKSTSFLSAAHSEYGSWHFPKRFDVRKYLSWLFQNTVLNALGSPQLHWSFMLCFGYSMLTQNLQLRLLMHLSKLKDHR